MEVLILATKYTFFVGFAGMAAATLYFMMERSSLDPEYRSTATLAAVITFVAAIHYQAMKVSVGTEASIDSLTGFPTEIRYIDWIITTPLMLVKFPILLKLGGNTKSLMKRLVSADILMIVSGYIGESSINRADAATGLGWIMFAIAIFSWGYIVYILYTSLEKAAGREPDQIKVGLRRMRTFILIGWAIYPLGYLATLVSGTVELQVVRELVYNVADLINKVGFGLVSVMAAKAMSSAKINGSAIAA